MNQEELRKWLKANKQALKPLLKYIEMKKSTIVTEIIPEQDPLKDQRLKGKYQALDELTAEITV